MQCNKRVILKERLCTTIDLQLPLTWKCMRGVHLCSTWVHCTWELFFGDPPWKCMHAAWNSITLQGADKPDLPGVVALTSTFCPLGTWRANTFIVLVGPNSRIWGNPNTPCKEYNEQTCSWPVCQSPSQAQKGWIIRINQLMGKCLRLLGTYASKIAKICNFWTFRFVIQLIEQLFNIWQKWFICWIRGQNVLWSQIYAIFEA